MGDSYTKMSQAIADVLGGDLAKAQRIVRTEAHRAISRGFQDVSDQTAYLLRESPYMEVKEWCSAEDGDVRSAHRKLDGVVLPVAEEFEVDGKRAACPCGFGVAELDINCRCFLKYSLVLRSEFEGRQHKAKQEQPAAQNTPQVQAGQMTLSTAFKQQTPAHAVEVQPAAQPEDGGTGTVYLPEKISGKPLTSGGSGGIIREQERMQSSSAYAVPKNLTESREFRSKFDSMDSDKKVQRQYYQVAKEMLRHRSGTNGEDLYFYNTRTKKWYRSITGTQAGTPDYTEEIRRALQESKKGDIVSFHNHPLGMPPSSGDLNAALKNGYKKGYTIGHDGSVFEYTSPIYIIDEAVYNKRISLHLEKGDSEFQAQINALRDLQEFYKFSFKEMKPDG